MIQEELKLRTQIRILILFFIIALTLSGITAFPIETELSLINSLLKNGPEFISNWIQNVFFAVHEMNLKYPFMSYGTDWLAFGHIIIAIFFIGPLKDPVKNIWIIQVGIIACILVWALAIIAGHIRTIPFFWQMIDCSFGVFGIIPLWISYRKTKQLERYLSLNTPPNAISIW